ncbi:hypothetical protein [Dyadobacter sediminis]|uniref:DUF1573 domain-containing protein n=1 Tax=Dyadobacter sediminis TaxID=1493691 RepID=A0A5R9KDR4_9BACT|nr:hypothetical protein [Dyadobacter sediminis]TLU94274.1 hypothetical protein FEM55_08460 [Dyadobacter sediminis]GGB92703.1 hypothetical protein GCM10011325_20160 [Dyadobacter sediminis]
MKPKIVGLSLVCFILFFIACKEKELDSPDITILSPTRNQMMHDNDSIRIKARIEPKNTFVVSSTVTLNDKKGHTLTAANIGCACDNKPVVNIEKAFLYKVKKKQDIILKVCAELKNGETICETVPFELNH